EADAKQIFAQLQELPPTQEIRNPFVEASRLYAGICLAELGKTGEAITALRKFVEDEPRLGLYKGEAWLELGRIAIERQFNPQEAGKYLQKCDDWIAEVREQERAPGIDAYSIVLDLPGVRKKTIEQIKPPETEKQRDFWGNVNRNPIEPGELVNRKTCRWYLDELQYRMLLTWGMALYANGDMEGSREKFAQLDKYDAFAPQDAQAIGGSTGARLVKAASPLGPRCDNAFLDVFREKRRIAALIGNFYYDALRWPEAERVYQNMLNGEYGRISKDEEAYAVYLLGNIQHMSGHEHAAIQHLGKFTTDAYAKTFIAPRALYTYAAICVQYRMRDGHYDKKWNDALTQVIRQYPDSPETERAVFLLAFASEVIGDIPTAADAYRAYLKRYPNGPYRDISQSHMNDLERKR
ncbi:MAG: tetratricopeptide repeat protein, partial [Phycisphaeraceae bacterium]